MRMARTFVCLLAFACLLATACGSKTGLTVPEEGAPLDAGMDAGRDAGPDAGPDAGADSGPDAAVCRPGNIPLDRSEVEVVFVIDRSGSMRQNFDGLSPAGSELSRWELLALSMDRALGAFDESVSVGAKFFPSRSARDVPNSCSVFDGLDVGIGPGRSRAVVNQFSRFDPAGGTPVGPAVVEAVDALLARQDGNAAQFIVVATDGAPSCGFDPVGDVVEAITDAHRDHAIDVFVVGIASTGPEVALLGRLATEGGRPRRIPGEPSYYDARNPDLLGDLLGEITSDLAQCVFAVPFPPDEDDTVEVQMQGEVVRRDPARIDGWDWTSEARGQLSLFGPACERAQAGTAVRAIITCGS